MPFDFKNPRRAPRTGAKPSAGRPDSGGPRIMPVGRPKPVSSASVLGGLKKAADYR